MARSVQAPAFQLPLLVTVLWMAAPVHADLVGAGHWPSFRGASASGVANPDQALPLTWNGETGEGVRFRRAIPGLAHGSPVIWGDKLFLTTAVSQDPSAGFVPGLYGSGEASRDRSVHEWRVLCLDKLSGEILWDGLATRGIPKDKRHIKATYANATPAVDEQRVVAWFGSEGLFAFDHEGALLWKKDLGRIDAGAYDLPSYEWGSASSPILHQGVVYVQADGQGDCFVMALDARNGRILWRTERDELPSWGTPTIYQDPRGKLAPELITNGSNFVRAYDPADGRPLWRLGGSSKITAPTPVFAEGLVVVTSGRAPERPIFAIRPGGRGDITGTGHVAWTKIRRGPYMPTPLIYRGSLYVLGNSGVFASYDLATGAEQHLRRIPHRGNGFSASPVAADGKLYLPSENGITWVLEAGGDCGVLARNPVGEPIMASPAVSEGILYLRGSRHLFAIGE